MLRAHNLSVEELKKFNPDLLDPRMEELVFRYKARNYPESLSKEENAKWLSFRYDKLSKGDYSVDKYVEKLQKMADEASPRNQEILHELIEYAQGLLPLQNNTLF